MIVPTEATATDAENQPITIHTQTVEVVDPRPAIAWIETNMPGATMTLNGKWSNHIGGYLSSLKVETANKEHATLFKLFFG